MDPKNNCRICLTVIRLLSITLVTMTTALTTPAPSPSTASLLPLRFPRVPTITLPHPAIVATLVDLARAGYPTATIDCPECSNTGRVVEGVYGGKIVYVSGCPECGRAGE